MVEFPDLLDVLLAERRVDEALAALDKGEQLASEAKEKETLSPSSLVALQSTITEHRQKLADQLAEAACQPSTRGSELRAAISALKRLGDGPRAHSLLLSAHYQRYQYNMQSLRPSNTSYGGAYTAALSQLVFSAIGQASSDSLAIFDTESSYTSELVMWATKQIEAFALLVQRHALASSAAAGGLRAAAECVQIALGHCSLLEARGLALCPLLLKLFRPSVEQALDANLKRIEESTAALAAADDWELTYPSTTARQSGRSSTSVGTSMSYHHKLSSSAHRFNMMVQVNIYIHAKLNLYYSISSFRTHFLICTKVHDVPSFLVVFSPPCFFLHYEVRLVNHQCNSLISVIAPISYITKFSYVPSSLHLCLTLMLL